MAESGTSNTNGPEESITIPYGGSTGLENELVILSLNVLDPPAGLTVTPPTSTNAWNLISDTDTAGTDYDQFVYWHAISSAEAAGVPDFVFTFNDAVEATGVAALYRNTCTQTTPTPCDTGTPSGNPILDQTSGNSTSANSVTETMDLDVQANGIAACVFGTSNTSVGFNTAPTSPTTLSHVNGNESINAGLDLYDRHESSTGTDGAWEALLPDSETGDNVAQCLSIIPIGF